MFLAIINDTYAEVKAEVKSKKPDFQANEVAIVRKAFSVAPWMGNLYPAACTSECMNLILFRVYFLPFRIMSLQNRQKFVGCPMPMYA